MSILILVGLLEFVGKFLQFVKQNEAPKDAQASSSSSSFSLL